MNVQPDVAILLYLYLMLFCHLFMRCIWVYIMFHVHFLLEFKTKIYFMCIPYWSLKQHSFGIEKNIRAYFIYFHPTLASITFPGVRVCVCTRV